MWPGLPTSLALLASMGCSLAATPDAPDAEAAASSATAMVLVERTSGPGDTLRGDAVIARFVRVRQGSVDNQVLRIAGANSDLPPVGTCTSVPSLRVDPGQASQPRNIELLDVGALALVARDAPSAAGNKTTELLPRTMFDPSDGVSGVFYSARSADAFTPSSQLRLQTNGGPDLPEGFTVDVPSPRDISDVHVTFQASSLDVTWEASDTDDSRDTVYVDVLSDGRLVTRCATSDIGKLVVKGLSLDEGQVAVHRLHRENFRAKGIDPGEVRFDVARVVNFHR